jgi:hypothetical protein
MANRTRFRLRVRQLRWFARESMTMCGVPGAERPGRCSSLAGRSRPCKKRTPRRSARKCEALRPSGITSRAGKPFLFVISRLRRANRGHRRGVTRFEQKQVRRDQRLSFLKPFPDYLNRDVSGIYAPP